MSKRRTPTRESKRFHLALLYLLLAGSSAWAQDATMYITDAVPIGLHRAADTSDTAFRSLLSGTELTVLESVEDFSRVRTADGDEGWVRSIYLVREPPAADPERLAAEAARAALDELTQRYEVYEESIARYRGSIPWPWVVAAIVVALCAGFLAGYASLEASIRRRYGGFRVY